MSDPLSTSPSLVSDLKEVLEDVYKREEEKKCLQIMIGSSGIPQSDRDDIIGNTWLAVSENIHTVRYNSQEDPITTAYRWVCGICRHKIADWWRGLGRNRESNEQAVYMRYGSAEKQSNFSEEIYDILEEALQLLKPKYSVLIEEIHLKERSYKELEEELGGTTDQLKARCYYARKKLSEKMIQLARKRLRLTPEWDEERRAALRSLIGE